MVGFNTVAVWNAFPHRAATPRLVHCSAAIVPRSSEDDDMPAINGMASALRSMNMSASVSPSAMPWYIRPHRSKPLLRRDFRATALETTAQTTKRQLRIGAAVRRFSEHAGVCRWITLNAFIRVAPHQTFGNLSAIFKRQRNNQGGDESPVAKCSARRRRRFVRQSTVYRQLGAHFGCSLHRYPRRGHGIISESWLHALNCVALTLTGTVDQIESSQWCSTRSRAASTAKSSQSVVAYWVGHVRLP